MEVGVRFFHGAPEAKGGERNLRRGRYDNDQLWKPGAPRRGTKVNQKGLSLRGENKGEDQFYELATSQR